MFPRALVGIGCIIDRLRLVCMELIGWGGWFLGVTGTVCTVGGAVGVVPSFLSCFSYILPGVGRGAMAGVVGVASVDGLRSDNVSLVTLLTPGAGGVLGVFSPVALPVAG